MGRIQCTFWQEAKRSRYRLRRYAEGKSNCPLGYHNAMGPFIHESDDLPTEEGIRCNNAPPTPPLTDERWPKKCDGCDYVFTPEDYKQVFGVKLFIGPEKQVVLDPDLPAGAMWYCDWYNDFWGPGPDGHSLVVKLPGGHEWVVDSEANNCTRKGDRTHKCWIREGVPPNVTAGKAGNTCSAGAGSIAVPGYHGFLRNGWLEEC